MRENLSLKNPINGGHHLISQDDILVNAEPKKFDPFLVISRRSLHFLGLMGMNDSLSVAPEK